MTSLGFVHFFFSELFHRVHVLKIGDVEAAVTVTNVEAAVTVTDVLYLNNYCSLCMFSGFSGLYILQKDEKFALAKVRQ